jgi:predicted alpha/beta superfamily hydrolase
MISAGARAFVLFALVCGLGCFAARPVEARRLDADISIGQGALLWSEVLREQRRILVHLPPHYDQAVRERYPVLYLLDAEEQFHHVTGTVRFLAKNERIPRLIVVGVTNTERERDLQPPTSSEKERADNPKAGGADDFLRFMADELVPWVDARFRTAPHRILVGHSFGGLFSLHALTNRPEAFQAHIAISPSLWWDEEAYAVRAREKLRKLPGAHFLFLSWGDHEPVIRKTTQELSDWLGNNVPRSIQWAARYYAGEDHGSTPHRGVYDGLGMVYAGWQFPYAVEADTGNFNLETVEAHYASLSERFGYAVEPDAAVINRLGKRLLERKNPPAAVALLERNAASHPYLSSVHEVLGRALEASGRPRDAVVEYRRALSLSLGEESAYGRTLSEHRQRIAEIEERMSGGATSSREH